MCVIVVGGILQTWNGVDFVERLVDVYCICVVVVYIPSLNTCLKCVN